MSIFTPQPVSIFGYVTPSDIVAYAADRTAAADQYIIQLGTVANSLVPPVVTPTFPTVTNPPAPAIPPVPTFENVVWTAPALPAAFTEQLDIDALLPPDFTGTPPTLNFGAAPAPFSEPAPDAPGIDLNYSYPSLSLALPAPPQLLTISVSAFSGVNIPTIDYTVPELQVVAPSVVEYVPGEFYTSALLTSVKNTLQDRIDNGGTGLPPEVEQAIWDRARERETKQLRDALDSLDRMEELGYAFPPGAYLDGRIKIETEFGHISVGHSREVMIKQAELEQQNVLKALDNAIALEGKLMDYTNSVEQRIFESCKYATQAGIEIYNARVRAYAAYVDAIKVRATIYEAQIRGEVAKVEAYKAQVEAEQAKAQVNTALIQQYKIQADVALANIEVYKAELAGIQTRAEIEKTKVQVFGEQVKAYAAKINAYTAGVEGFRATIQAETSKQEAFRTQVQAYTAQVEASVKVIEANIEEYKGKIAAKNAEWDGYKAAAEAESARARAIAANNSSLADSYKAEISGINMYNEVLTKQWQVAYEQAQRAAEIGVSAAKANAELYMTTRSLALDAAKVGAQVSAQLGAAALNAINFSQSTSSSQSNSYSSSQSSSWSYSENRNYNLNL